MWQGKKKAVTFSFDDGVTQDRRLVELLNKYGLKCTFNINSSLLGTLNTLSCAEWSVSHNKIKASEVKSLYAGHEVAVHTLTHPRLPELDDETVLRQVDEDRKALEILCGYPIVGMAYPCGGVNNDARVAKLIAENTPIRYARTIEDTRSLKPQTENLLQFHPTLHFGDRLEELVDAFIASESEEEQLLYVWGHSYELDIANRITWEQFEKICQKLSGRGDIFYGTNKEVLL